EDLLRQPAIQPAELRFIGHVPQVIVDDRHIANAFLNGVLRDLHGKLGPLLRLHDSPKPAFVPAKGKAKQIANLAKLVARQTHGAVTAELQAEMAKSRDLASASKNKV